MTLWLVVSALAGLAQLGPLAPAVAPLPDEQASLVLDRIGRGEAVERALLHRALLAGQTTLRAYAARALGEHGDESSVPYLIDALSDESFHVGARYVTPGMETTRYWAHKSLRMLTGERFGFVWDAPAEQRRQAILRWREWYLARGGRTPE